MKRIFFALVLLTSALPSWAQKSEFDPKVDALGDGQTLIKSSITSLLFGNFSLAVERTLNKHFSAQLSAYYHPWTTTFLSKGQPYPDHRFSSDIHHTDLVITQEVRWYLGQSGYGKGFYFAPYYRYTHTRAKGLTYNFPSKDDLSEDPDGYIDLTTNVGIHSFGLAIGAQWLLGKKKNIVLDWMIIGLHYGWANTHIRGEALSYTGSTYTEEDFKKAKARIDDRIMNNYWLPGKEGITYDVTQQTVSVHNTGIPWSFFRFGLSIGYRF